MSSNYKYKDQRFNSKILKEHLDVQYGKKLDIKNAGRQILQWHLEQGGLPPRNKEKLEEEEVVDNIISTAIKVLKRGGARKTNWH